MKNIWLLSAFFLVTTLSCYDDFMNYFNTNHNKVFKPTLKSSTDKVAKKMRSFISEIAEYSRDYNPNFIIVPQNGVELCFHNLEINDGTEDTYLNAIDGLGVESLFRFDSITENDTRLEALQILKDSKRVLVSDYLTKNEDLPLSVSKNFQEGFISFPRNANNYHYTIIPDSINHENTKNITSLKDAENYLYLINSGNFDSKATFIEALQKTNYDVLLIDLFFGETPFSSEEINALKFKNNGSKRLVLSYINIGAAESYRYYWNPKWKLGSPSWLQKKYDGYDDEIWVAFWKSSWKKIIFGNNESYIKKILDAGFDGAYLDNVEAYYFLNAD